MMTIRSRGVLALLLSVLFLYVLAPGAGAQTPQKSLKDRLVGHWQLVSVSIGGNAPYGSNPQGTMFLDAGGHFAIIVITAGRARSIAYFGTYTVDDAAGAMTLHIDGSNRLAAGGRDQKRLVSFDGDQLIVTTSTAGPLGAFKLIWKQTN